jgi:hypothetical protein
MTCLSLYVDTDLRATARTICGVAWLPMTRRVTEVMSMKPTKITSTRIRRQRRVARLADRPKPRLTNQA